MIDPIPDPGSSDREDCGSGGRRSGVEQGNGDSGSRGLPRLAYRVSEVARMLGVSEKTVRRLIARGFFKPSKALRHLLIPRRQVEQFLERTIG